MLDEMDLNEIQKITVELRELNQNLKEIKSTLEAFIP
jgi:hypothetical protein